MELPMTDNTAFAVAATGGAAGAQDQEIPEPVITIPEVWRLQFTLPWPITLADAAVFGGVILLAATYVLGDVTPQRTWIAQAWMFSKLLFVLFSVYGAFGVLCTVWDKLYRASRSSASPPEGVRPQEVKRELVKRWIDNLPVEKTPEEEKNNEESEIIDPVGDGTPLGEADTEIKNSKSIIGEVLAHQISLEDKRAQTPTDYPQVPMDTTSAIRVFRTEHRIAESGCPGGDVAWSMVQMKESRSHENRQEVLESPPLNVQKPVIIPEIKTEHFDNCHMFHSQEGLNFTDESPDDTAGSNTPAEDVTDVVRVFSKGILSNLSTTPPKENILDSLKVDEEWQGAVGPEQHVTSNTVIGPSQEEYAEVAYDRPTTRPPSQPAGASSAFSVSQAFLLESNGLDDNEYALLEAMTALQERSVTSQTSVDHQPHAALALGGYPQCPHRYCCRNHADHNQGIEFNDNCLSANVDLLDESRPMPGSYFGVPRSMCDADHMSKFHLTVIPEDDLPQSV